MLTSSSAKCGNNHLLLLTPPYSLINTLKRSRNNLDLSQKMLVADVNFSLISSVMEKFKFLKSTIFPKSQKTGQTLRFLRASLKNVMGMKIR